MNKNIMWLPNLIPEMVGLGANPNQKTHKNRKPCTIRLIKRVSGSHILNTKELI
jgi:hypothetical protein